MLANSERYTSGAKSAWKADFHPDVTRPETGSGENGDWMRKMEIGSGETGMGGGETRQRGATEAGKTEKGCWETEPGGAAPSAPPS